MTPITHYIVVRRDLPFGLVLANIAHAAGESMFISGTRHEELPSFNPHEALAIVLGARNEGRLLRLERSLIASRVEYIAIREHDAPYNGALMAIGIVPGPRHLLSKHVREFHMFPHQEAPMDTEPRETDETPSTPPTTIPDATGDSTPTDTPPTPAPEGD